MRFTRTLRECWVIDRAPAVGHAIRWTPEDARSMMRDARERLAAAREAETEASGRWPDG
jgi:hypothetical protein